MIALARGKKAAAGLAHFNQPLLVFIFPLRFFFFCKVLCLSEKKKQHLFTFDVERTDSLKAEVDPRSFQPGRSLAARVSRPREAAN